MVVSERVIGSSTDTRMIAGSSVCAQVDATGPNPASPTTSRSPKVFSARRSAVTACGFWSTISSLRDSATSLTRCDDPAGGHPTLALIGQLDLEPVRVLADDLELRSVRDLVDDAGGDRWAAADVRRVDGDHGQVLRQRCEQRHADARLDHGARLIDQRRPEVGCLEVLGDFD